VSFDEVGDSSIIILLIEVATGSVSEELYVILLYLQGRVIIVNGVLVFSFSVVGLTEAVMDVSTIFVLVQGLRF